MADPTRRRSATSSRTSAGVNMSGLDNSVGFMLKRAQLAVSAEIHGAFADFDITAVQFSVLTVVSNNPGISQGELATALDVERPRMVPVLDKLERRGLTQRRQDACDGRTRRIHLTDDGAGLLSELQARFARLEKRLASALGSANRRQLLDALTTLATTAD